jgi:hypothetical protein
LLVEAAAWPVFIRLPLGPKYSESSPDSNAFYFCKLLIVFIFLFVRTKRNKNSRLYKNGLKPSFPSLNKKGRGILKPFYQQTHVDCFLFLTLRSFRFPVGHFYKAVPEHLGCIMLQRSAFLKKMGPNWLSIWGDPRLICCIGLKCAGYGIGVGQTQPGILWPRQDLENA